MRTCAGSEAKGRSQKGVSVESSGPWVSSTVSMTLHFPESRTLSSLSGNAQYRFMAAFGTNMEGAPTDMLPDLELAIGFPS